MEFKQFFTAFNSFNRFVSDIFNRFIYQILLTEFLYREKKVIGRSRSDFLFGSTCIGIRGCFELNLPANMFCRAMIYFNFGA